MLSTSLVLILLAAAGGMPVNHGQQAIAPLVTDGPAVPSHTYAKGDVEYYMSDEQKDYIRPGLTTEIVSIVIGEDRRPVVELAFIDDMGLPLDRAGALTPGAHHRELRARLVGQRAAPVHRVHDADPDQPDHRA